MSKAIALSPIFQERYTAEDLALIERAFRFAEKAHGGQVRASGESYIIHPVAAAETLAKLNIDATTIAAAILHDIIDDTPITIDEIEKEFGKEVTFLVNGVTKLGKLKYRGVERQAENLRKIFLAMAEDIRVVLIKLADRLHNMETLSHLPERKQYRIALETLEIYAPLAARLGIGELKARLDDLAFQYVYPKEYAWLLEHVKELYSERQKYCAEVKPAVSELLAQAGVTVIDIQARAKHYWSLWQKLQRYNMDLTKMYDLVALRIIVPDVTACYAALGAIHNRWKPLPGRIKDYIALPKPNGYQSLHTTVFCDDGKITEFQIRTPEMHAHAEYGIAAHWAYVEKGKPFTGAAVPPKLKWVEQLTTWQREVHGTEEFLDSLRIDFFRDRIFVFTPKGDVIELPEGGTPIDFAYHVHSAIGDEAVGARVNDKFVGLDTPLANGDVIEIIRQRGKKPSTKLLEIAKTAQTKGHIRKALREQGIQIAAAAPQALKAEVHLGVEDRVGLLKDISAEVSREGINIISIEGKGEGETAGISLIVQIPTRTELKKLLERLKKIRGVHEATGRII